MTNDFTVKDSGERQSFETGSVRDSREGKGRFDLIPALPHKRLAQHYEAGAAKYGDYNWQKGQPLMRYVDSAERHINNLKAGMVDEDHATAVQWNMQAYVWTLDAIERGALPQSLDDRPGSAATRLQSLVDDTVKAVQKGEMSYAAGLAALGLPDDGFGDRDIPDMAETDYYRAPLAGPCGDHVVGDDPECCGQYSLHTGAV